MQEITAPEPAAALPQLTPEERRCFPRFEIGVIGTCSINRGPDVHCTAVDVSLGGIALRTSALTNVGDAVIAIFREFGLVRGRVVRLFEDGFALRFDKVDPHRSRLSQYLVWRLRGDAEGNVSLRRHERLVPLNRIMTLSRTDGRVGIGRIENVSRSGVAFTSTAGFDVGEAVRIGRHRATIVRVFAGGAAAAFETLLEADGFDVMISFARPG